MSFFCMWISRFPNTICQEFYIFFTAHSWYPCQRSVDYVCVGLFVRSVLFHWPICQGQVRPQKLINFWMAKEESTEEKGNIWSGKKCLQTFCIREIYCKRINHESVYKDYKVIYDEEMAQRVMESEVLQSALCTLEMLGSQGISSNPNPKAWDSGEALA